MEKSFVAEDDGENKVQRGCKGTNRAMLEPHGVNMALHHENLHKARERTTSSGGEVRMESVRRQNRTRIGAAESFLIEPLLHRRPPVTSCHPSPDAPPGVGL